MIMAKSHHVPRFNNFNISLLKRISPSKILKAKTVLGRRKR
jgi:hypothetical protein